MRSREGRGPIGPGRALGWLGVIVAGVACAAPIDAQEVEEARRAVEGLLNRPIGAEDLLRALRESGITIEELRDELEARGYDPAEAEAYAPILGGVSDSLPPGTDALPLVEILAEFEADVESHGEVPAARTPIEPVGRPEIFGRALFGRSTSQFEPIPMGPAPRDYRVGPGDELIVVLTGAVEQSYTLEVTPEGWVVLPDVGRIVVNGLSLEDVRGTLFNRLSAVYSGLRRGPDASTFVDVSLGTLRTNRVYVIGEVERPAAYDVSSLATALTALYWAGGPADNGSFREVVVNRGGERVATIDLYSYLLSGSAEGDLRLEQGDVVYVPPVQRRIEVDGAVMRPGLYELREDETLADAIRFTGGVEPSADLRHVQIQRILPQAERRPGSDRVTLDVSLAALDQAGEVPLRRGDRITVFAVLDDPRNRVSISGGVWRPGTYGVDGDTRLWDVITRAGGLLPDAYRPRAQIQRLRPADQTRRMFAVTLERDAGDGPLENPRLEGMDQILIYARRDLREERVVSIAGWVREPGVYPYSDGLTVPDLILKAGGLRTGAYIGSAEVSRVLISQSRSDTLTQRFEVSLDSVYLFGVDAGGANGSALPSGAAAAESFALSNLDAVYVRKAPGFEGQRQVVVTGEVAFPGPYSLVTRDERITDLIERAGGATRQAHAEALQLWRAGPVDPDSLPVMGVAAGPLRDEAADDPDGEEERLGAASPSILRTRVGVDYPSAVRNPGGIHNLALMPHDSVHVPSYIPTVEVRGSVGVESRVLYREGAGLDYYIDQAGGYSHRADRSRTRVRYANGAVHTRGKKFLFFGGGVPDPDPGSLVTVPTKEQSPSGGGGFREWVGVLSTLATAAATIIVVSR